MFSRIERKFNPSGANTATMERRNENGEPAQKRTRTEDNDFKVQQEKLKFLENEFRKFKKEQLISVLVENGQFPFDDDYDQIINRTCDMAHFGVPYSCPECEDVVQFHNGVYACTGFSSAFVKCTFQTKQCARTQFYLPPDIRSCVSQDFLKKLKFSFSGVTEERIYEKNNEPRLPVCGSICTSFCPSRRVHDVLKELSEKTEDLFVFGEEDQVPFDNVVQKINKLITVKEYKVLLSFVEVSQKMNAFVKMEIVEFGGWYAIYYEFGETGETEKIKRSIEIGFRGCLDAVAKFKERFIQLTNCLWEDRQSSDKKKGFYNLVETEWKEIDLVNENGVEAGSVQSVQLINFLKSIEEGELVHPFENMLHGAQEMSLGILSQSQFKKALDLLSLIREELNEEERDLNYEKLLELSNQFYSIFPHNQPKIIDNLGLIWCLKKSIRKLMKIAAIHLKFYESSSTQQMKLLSPNEAICKVLKCEMKPVALDSPEGQLVVDQIYNTVGSYKELIVPGAMTIEIFDLDREEENLTDLFLSRDRKLLFHGVKKENVVECLREGIPIDESAENKRKFGNGIYFSDMFCESYRHSKDDAGVAYVFLCDVSVGRPKVALQKDRKIKLRLKELRTVKGQGRHYPHPIGDYLHPRGYVIHRGLRGCNAKETKGHPQFRYNKYVVYNKELVKLRYLVRVKSVPSTSLRSLLSSSIQSA